jgi:hypothetical protein
MLDSFFDGRRESREGVPDAINAAYPYRDAEPFFAAETIACPLLACDCLYAEPGPFGLSAFGFLASLFPLCRSFATLLPPFFTFAIGPDAFSREKTTARSTSLLLMRLGRRH